MHSFSAVEAAAAETVEEERAAFLAEGYQQNFCDDY